MPFNQGGMQGGMPGGMQGGMEGGMFGPPGGPQNLGGQVMSDLELQRLLGQMGQMQSPRGGSDVASLPIYDMPAQLPQGTPSLETGIDPSMMAGPPPTPPTDFGAQAITEGAGIGQQGIMNMGIQELMERKRLERLRAAGGGAVVPPGIGATPPPMNRFP
jgi:hypothetical protein